MVIIMAQSAKNWRNMHTHIHVHIEENVATVLSGTRKLGFCCALDKLFPEDRSMQFAFGGR